MAPEDLATQGTRASATMISTLLNQIISSLALGLSNMVYVIN